MQDMAESATAAQSWLALPNPSKLSGCKCARMPVCCCQMHVHCITVTDVEPGVGSLCVVLLTTCSCFCEGRTISCWLLHSTDVAVLPMMQASPCAWSPWAPITNNTYTCRHNSSSTATVQTILHKLTPKRAVGQVHGLLLSSLA